jgi:hypothetical protein
LDEVDKVEMERQRGVVENKRKLKMSWMGLGKTYEGQSGPAIEGRTKIETTKGLGCNQGPLLG